MAARFEHTQRNLEEAREQAFGKTDVGELQSDLFDVASVGLILVRRLREVEPSLEAVRAAMRWFDDEAEGLDFEEVHGAQGATVYQRLVSAAEKAGQS